VSVVTADTMLAGYLPKKSRTLKVWQRKWFVLNKRDCALFVFRAPEDVVASRAVPLIGYTLAADYNRSGEVVGMLCATMLNKNSGSFPQVD
jgi:hypothetical protein